MRQITLKIFSIILLSSSSFTSEFLTFDAAMKKAKDEKKEVLLIFSGSDWCKPCILLKKNILDTDEFKNYAEQNLVMLHLDFPYKKANKLEDAQAQHNAQLAETYNLDGIFPRVVLLNNSKTLLGEVSYSKDMSPSQFIDQLNEITK